MTSFSRDLDAPFDVVWSSVTNVAGATFFGIKNFDKGSGLMTLDYSNMREFGYYVDCGSLTGGLAIQFQNFPGLPQHSVLNSVPLKKIDLAGTGNITIRAIGPRKTHIQINSLYELTGYNTDVVDGKVVLTEAAQWRFTTRDADAQQVGYRNIICRPSYKLESDFLTEVSARL